MVSSLQFLNMTYYVKYDNPSNLSVNSIYNKTVIPGFKKNDSKIQQKTQNHILHTSFIDVRDMPLLPMSSYFQSKVPTYVFT